MLFNIQDNSKTLLVNSCKAFFRGAIPLTGWGSVWMILWGAIYLGNRGAFSVSFSTLIADYKEYGLMTFGFWSIILCSTFGAVLIILPFVIVYTIFYKYTKSFDFDKNLKKNAVDWFPQFEKEK